MNQLKATLDRFEEDKAVILFDNGQKLIVAKTELDQEIKEGDTLYISISSNIKETDDQQKIAKNILQEILNKDEG